MRIKGLSNTYRYLSILTLLILCFSLSVKQTAGQDRLKLEEVSKQPATHRPGTEPVKRTSRFVLVEQSQRAGIQQLGEANADAVANISIRKAVARHEQLTDQALTQSRAGHFEKAEELYQKALEIKPDYLEAREGLGITYIQLGDYQKAIELFQQIIDQYGERKETLLNLGVAFYRSGNINDAIIKYQRALTITKEPFSNAHFNLAMALSHQGKFDEAIQQYRTAIKARNNNYPEAYNNMGLIYQAMGEETQALAAFNNALQQQKNRYPLAHFNIAQIYVDRRDDEKALAALQMAIQQQPEFAEAYATMGNIYLYRLLLNLNTETPAVRAQKLDKTLSLYLKAAELREDYYPLAHEMIALTLVLKGKKEECWPYFRKAIKEQNGQCSSTWQNLIKVILYNQDQLSLSSELGRVDNPGNLKHARLAAEKNFSSQQALRDLMSQYEELEDEDKDIVDIRFSAGVIYMALGDNSLATKELSRALELSQGKDTEAKTLLENLAKVNSK